MVVGNIMIGERYVEPQGSAWIKCSKTGTSAEIQFKIRGWTTRQTDLNTVFA
jgi:hypothetical protein